jgi:hypothetical protein
VQVLVPEHTARRQRPHAVINESSRGNRFGQQLAMTEMVQLDRLDDARIALC